MASTLVRAARHSQHRFAAPLLARGSVPRALAGRYGSVLLASSRSFGTAKKIEVLEVEHHPKRLSDKVLPPFRTLGELIEVAGDRYAEREALGVKKDGAYSFRTYAQVKADVATCRSALSALGVQRGDRVAIISRNRYEWVLTAYAGYGIEAINVPMYEQQKKADWQYIVEDSDAKVLIVSTEDIYNQVKEWEGKLAHLTRIFCCDLPDDHPDSFASFMALGTKPLAPVTVHPDSLATLIYTSGTTGKPKGVMLSHHNLVSNLKSVVDHNPGEELLVTADDRSVAFLPWAHSYGQTCELHSGLAIGASTAIAAGAPGDAAELLANIQEVKPTVLFSVPTLFAKVYDGIQARVREATGIQKFLMERALAVGETARIARKEKKSLGWFTELQFKFLDKVVLTKMRAPFGGRLKYGIVAGAPTPVDVLHFMESLGVQMVEGYGLTETAPVVAVTYPDPSDRMTGTVGRVIPEVDVKVVMDGQECPEGTEGELWVSGPNVLQGYWKRPDATAEVLVTDPDGKKWFRTGDLAIIYEKKHIKITGRIKEQYKLENGKYVAPAPIEEAISLSPYVNQCVLYGTGKPHNVVIVVPDYAAVAKKLGVKDGESDPEALIAMPETQALFKDELRRVAEQYNIKKYEAPKNFLLLSEPFSSANEMLTPKLSIRKQNVVNAYQDKLDALYK